MNFASRRIRLHVLCSVLASAASLALVAASCGGDGTIVSNELPLKQEFSECLGFSMNDEVATVDCPDGELRLLVKQPEVSPIHFVPFRFDKRQQTLVVSAEARVHEVQGEAWGIGCLASKPGEGGRGYLLAVVAQGAAGLVRFEFGSVEGDQNKFATLPAPEVDVKEPSARHMLRIRCTKTDAGAVRVHGSVDNGKALIAVDDPGIGPFTGAVAIAFAEKPGTDTRFDNLNVDGTPEAAREDTPAPREVPRGDQEARIELVRATAAKTTRYGEVTSVFCQSEYAGCVVTYSEIPESSHDDSCQMWYVENVNGKDVATPEKEDPIEGGHGTYSEDNPNVIGCKAG